MTFDELQLSAEEIRTLKRSLKTSVPVSLCERLIRHKLVEEDVIHIPGYAGVKQGTCRITPLGQDYLAYITTRRKEKNAEWIRYIITTAIAVAALIISIIALTAELCSPISQLP